MAVYAVHVQHTARQRPVNAGPTALGVQRQWGKFPLLQMQPTRLAIVLAIVLGAAPGASGLTLQLRRGGVA